MQNNEDEELSKLSRMTPSFFHDKNAKAALQRREARKLQRHRRLLGREPDDMTGKDPEGWSDLCRREKGKEDLPGVSNRTSLHILTVTDGEIKEDTLKSKAFINRYYKAFDDQDNPYSIWSLLETLRDKGRYRPQDITIEELETINRNFDKHAKQILGQLSLDAAERHAREGLRRKNIEFIGMCLSAITSLGGSVTGFMNDGSKESTQRLAEMGYSQIVIGIAVALILKFISNQVEEHTKAARNLDVTLSWIEFEVKRLKKDLIALQEPYLEKLRANSVGSQRPRLPIETQLFAMKYIWLRPNTLSPEKSLFESVARLQRVLFGHEETAESVEMALADFRSRERLRRGLLQQSTFVMTALEALAQIYNCTIVLISEVPLVEQKHYQIINEPVEPVEDADQENKEAEEEDAISLGSRTVERQVKPTPPIRYMVLYMLREGQYQPILAPMNITWPALKVGLLDLPALAISVPSEVGDEQPPTEGMEAASK